MSHRPPRAPSARGSGMVLNGPKGLGRAYQAENSVLGLWSGKLQCRAKKWGSPDGSSRRASTADG
jgi:hypothetical protein